MSNNNIPAVTTLSTNPVDDYKKNPSLNTKSNCSDFKKFTADNFVLNENTKFIDDKCLNDGELKQNNNVNDYMLSNYSGCDCDINNVLEISNKNRGITIKDGYGISNCNIDSDSKLRVGNLERHYKSKQQLFPRPYLTSPFISKGEQNPDMESKLLASIQNIKHKQMQNYGEDYVFTPLNANLVENVQNTRHIITEDISNTWIRGGMDTRQTVKDNDYLNNSIDSDVVKKILLSKKPYLDS